MAQNDAHEYDEFDAEDDNEFIITDEFDSETLALMAELGI